tara:strand:+ start:91951 stop:92520 length:570 start_codon:yes stop_codon:yes gene_type:complete
MNIFVGRLSYETQENNLRALFEQIGQVKSLKIITDRETGKSKGFAFVTMANREDGQKAITQLDGTALDGRNISVSEAEDRKSNERKPTTNQGQKPDFRPRREESRDEEETEDGGKPEKNSFSPDWSEAPSKGTSRKNSPNKKKKEAPKGRGGDDDGFRRKKMSPKPPKSKKNRGWGEDDDDDIFGDFKF